MLNDFYIYKFDEFNLDEKERKLFANSERIRLQPKAFQVLLLLVKNAGEIVSNEEILSKVWEGRFVEESNVNTQVKAIRNALGQTENCVFIETEEKGFRFVVPVKRVIKTSQTLVRDIVENEPKEADYQDNTKEIPVHTENEPNAPRFDSRNWLVLVSVMLVALLFYYLGFGFSSNLRMGEYQLAFIYSNSFFYGALAAITLILETAYEFHKYRRNVARMAPCVFLINAMAMYAGLTGASRFLPERTDYAFFAGLVFLVVGTSLSCVLAYFVLPNVPITKSKEEKTQPAFLAYLKNVGFYFFLVYLFFGLFIFCLTYGSAENYKNMSFAFVFLLIWGFLTLLSWVSINIFNGSLKTAEDGDEYKRHGLFVSMSYLRLFFCFLPTLANIGIYFFSVK